MKRVNLRLNVTEEERDAIRTAAAIAGYRSMATFCSTVVLAAARAVAESNSASLIRADIRRAIKEAIE